MQQDGDASHVAWLIERALEGASGGDVLEAFCTRLMACGLALLRVQAGTTVLDPTFEAQSFSWQRGHGVTMREYPRRDDVWNHSSWTSSPFHRLQVTRERSLRRRIGPIQSEEEFPLLRDLREIGGTDYLAFRVPYANPQLADGTFDLMISWTTDRPDGFTKVEMATLGEVAPALALACVHARNALVTRNVLATYLGCDAAGACWPAMWCAGGRNASRPRSPR